MAKTNFSNIIDESLKGRDVVPEKKEETKTPKTSSSKAKTSDSTKKTPASVTTAPIVETPVAESIQPVEEIAEENTKNEVVYKKFVMPKNVKTTKNTRSFYIDDDIFEKIKSISEETNNSISETINMILRQVL